jgi:DNA-binding MarR family transcriptional regulator
VTDEGRTPARGLSRADYQALAGLRLAIRRFLAFSESAARSVGLSPRQYQALLAIRGSPTDEPVTVGGLAATLGIRHHSAVGLVNRLCALGLLRRHVGADDRRRVYLTPTPEGGRKLQRLAAVHRLELRRMRPQLVGLLSRLGPRGRKR